jgi:hypothetical protein
VVPLGAVNTGLLAVAGTGCSAGMAPNVTAACCACTASSMPSRARCIARAASSCSMCGGCSGAPSGQMRVSADSCSSAPPSLYFWSRLLARRYCQPRGLLQRLQRRSTRVYSPVDSLCAGHTQSMAQIFLLLLIRGCVVCAGSKGISCWFTSIGLAIALAGLSPCALLLAMVVMPCLASCLGAADGVHLFVASACVSAVFRIVLFAGGAGTTRLCSRSSPFFALLCVRLRVDSSPEEQRRLLRTHEAFPYQRRAASYLHAATIIEGQ